MAASVDKITELTNSKERVGITGLWEWLCGDLKKLEDWDSREFVLFQNIQTGNITTTAETSDNKTADEAKQLKPMLIVVRRCAKTQDLQNSERPERPVCVFILFGNGTKRIKAVVDRSTFIYAFWRLNKLDKFLFKERFLAENLFSPCGAHDSHTSSQLIKKIGVEGGLVINHYLGFAVEYIDTPSKLFKGLMDENIIALADFEFLKTIASDRIPSSETERKLKAELEAAFDGIVATSSDMRSKASLPATTSQIFLYEQTTKTPTATTPGSATASTPDSSRSANSVSSVTIDIK